MPPIRRRLATAPASPPPAAWHSRGFLPHFDRPGLLQAITFRLHDSIPAHLLAAWRAELVHAARLPNAALRQIELRRRLARHEDAGHGACWLRDPRIASVVENAMLHFDGARYRLLAWCIMPNHVHALIELGDEWPLEAIIHAWKSFAASRANKLLHRSGAFWFREYHDRYIRDADHFENAVNYIDGNPVKAGLARSPEEWPFSSAARRQAEKSEARKDPAGREPSEARQPGCTRHPSGPSSDRP